MHYCVDRHMVTQANSRMKQESTGPVESLVELINLRCLRINKYAMYRDSSYANIEVAVPEKSTDAHASLIRGSEIIVGNEAIAHIGH